MLRRVSVAVVAAALVTTVGVGASLAARLDEALVEAAYSDDRAAVAALLGEGANPDALAEDGSTPLSWAAIRGNLEVAELLLSAGADPDLSNTLGVGPVDLSIEHGTSEVTGLLLARGASPNVVRENGQTPLMTAARLGQVDVMRQLLERGADPNAVEKRFGQTALMWAAGNPRAVRLLLDHGADPTPTTRSWDVTYTVYIPTSFTLGKTGIPWNSDGQYTSTRGGQGAVFFAARKRNLASVRQLLDAGVSVNVRAADGTSLLLAALYNWVPLDQDFQPGRGAPARAGSSQRYAPYLDMAHILLDRGVSATAADTAGYTPLHAAALAVAWVSRPRDKRSDGVYRTLPALLTLDTPPEPPPFQPDEALGMVRRLLDQGADPNVQTRYPTPGPDGDVRINPAPPGSSALHIAAGSTSLALVRLLLDAGSDVNLVRKDGHSPFTVAVVARDMPIIDELIARGADLEATYDPDDRYPDPAKAVSLPRQGQSVVHIAAGNRSTGVIEFLHARGARIDRTNHQGESPLDLADHQERFQEALDRQNTDGDPERLKKVTRVTETTDAIRQLLEEESGGRGTAGP